MFVLRRIDCLLEDTKEAVLAEVKFQKDEAGMAVLDPDGLRETSGQVFYNTSKFNLKSLLGTGRAGSMRGSGFAFADAGTKFSEEDG